MAEDQPQAISSAAEKEERRNEDPPQIASVSLQSRIPPFWREQPALWFCQFEAAISGHKTGDLQKYHLVIAQLERQDIIHVSDIVRKPPETNKYEAIKQRLINAYEESESSQFQKLLGGLELGDQKPSYLLRRMRDLAGNMMADDALRVMWLRQLPTQVRAVLSVNKDSSLEGLASSADKMLEHTQQGAIYAVSANTPSTTSNDFETLSRQIEKLTLEIAELRGKPQSPYYHGGARNYNRSRSNSQNRRRSNSNSRKPGDPDWLCFYHYRFGDEARRCEPPCSKKKSTEN